MAKIMVTNTTETKGSVEALLVETGEQRDRRDRRLMPAARRVELVGAWRASGLTQAGFARREGLNYFSFAAWVQAARLESAVAGFGFAGVCPVRASAGRHGVARK